MAAGATPNSRPVHTDASRVAANTVASSATPSARGRVVKASNPGIAHAVRASPIAPPDIESTRLSVNSCRMIRARLAPSALRTDISRLRASAREVSSPATFAQAMSSTHPAAPARISSDRLVDPTVCSSSEEM